MAEFKKRVYGCAIVKAINSNYNADFSGQPRTLPDGIVYATDKAFKYSIKKYLKDAYENVDVFYMKTLNDNLNPRSLDERYENLFGAIRIYSLIVLSFFSYITQGLKQPARKNLSNGFIFTSLPFASISDASLSKFPLRW